jgi:hypothetical protein
MNQCSLFLFGGLGNNLFQLNLAYRLYEIGFSVLLNEAFLKTNLFTNKILKWKSHDSSSFLRNLPTYRSLTKTKHASLYELVNLGLLKIASARDKNLLLDTPNIYESIPSILWGYFHLQNEPSRLLISEIQSTLLSMLQNSPNLKAIIDKINSHPTSVLAHVRGQDFSDPRNNILMKTDYYTRALKKYKVVYVVSDDHALAHNILNPINARVVHIHGTTSWEDFCILAFARCKILSNSTFSWWAAEVSPKYDFIAEPSQYYPPRKWNPISLTTRVAY